MRLFRRREPTYTYGHLADANDRLREERDRARDLAERRYELLQAMCRENDTLRAQLGQSQRDALGATAPLPRVRSATPPAAPGPMCIADGELWMQPIRRRE